MAKNGFNMGRSKGLLGLPHLPGFGCPVVQYPALQQPICEPRNGFQRPGLVGLVGRVKWVLDFEWLWYTLMIFAFCTLFVAFKSETDSVGMITSKVISDVICGWFHDEEIVALSGAHGLGACHTDRSGFWGPWTRAPTTVSALSDMKELSCRLCWKEYVGTWQPLMMCTVRVQKSDTTYWDTKLPVKKELLQDLFLIFQTSKPVDLLCLPVWCCLGNEYYRELLENTWYLWLMLKSRWRQADFSKLLQLMQSFFPWIEFVC